MKKKKSVLKIIAYVLVLSLSLTVLQPLSVFAAENVNASETTLENGCQVKKICACLIPKATLH